MKKGLLDLSKLNSTQGYNAPHLKTVPTNVQMNTSTAAAVPAKPHRNEIWGILLDKRKVPHGWPSMS